MAGLMKISLPPPLHAEDMPGLTSKASVPALHISLLCISQPLYGSCITWKLVMELPFLPSQAADQKELSGK